MNEIHELYELQVVLELDPHRAPIFRPKILDTFAAGYGLDVRACLDHACLLA